ncbi:MAG: Zn-ribbon domain-containing OB-fold protein [Actinobacteria bacterium]|nr:Zn-ribbon domain-containing OB-fold protein [Actinomycetota bacterium]
MSDETQFDDRFRVPPALDETNRFFWTSGADGRLRFLRCAACGYWLHPPSPWCPECGGRDVAPEAVSGRGVVHSVTVNHQAWDGDQTPYAVALVELDEQAGLRLTTNIVGVDPELVTIDDRVHVVFEQRGDVYYPLFELDPDPAPAFRPDPDRNSDR